MLPGASNGVEAYLLGLERVSSLLLLLRRPKDTMVLASHRSQVADVPELLIFDLVVAFEVVIWLPRRDYWKGYEARRSAEFKLQRVTPVEEIS